MKMLLAKLAEQHGIALYGLAWRDRPDTVAEWLAGHGNPYRAVGVDAKGTSTVALGLTGVPETLLIDRRGMVRFRYAAPLTQDVIDTQLLPKLAELRHAP